MGATYDLVISAADLVEERIGDFLSERHLPVSSVADLGSVEIYDDNVTLIGPSQNGFVQVVVHCSALGIDLADWYEFNPLAAALARQGKASLHLWSLDSGFVAGYSGYLDGAKVESDHCFSKHAKRTDMLMESVQTPTTQEGNSLQKFLQKGKPSDTSVWKNDGDLELGIANLVAKMGFDAHLVGLFEALDNQEGIAVYDDKYRAVHLSSWKAFIFDEHQK